MGWADAPIITDQPAGKPRWMDAPEIVDSVKPNDPRAAALAEFERANPGSKGSYTVDTFPYMAEYGGKTDAVPANPPAKGSTTTIYPDTFGDTTAAMVAEPWAATKAFAGGLVGGPSPSREFLAQDPMTKGLPDWMLTQLGGVGDTGMAALSGIGTAINGAAGLASEMVPGASQQTEQDLAQGSVLASQFAAPELFGVSGSSLNLAGKAAAKAPSVVAPIAKAIPDVTTESLGATIGQAAKASKAPTGPAAQALAADFMPDAKTIEAAKNLGFDLPADVFSKNELIRRAAGLPRGLKGTAEDVAWIGTIVKASDAADAAMSKLATGDISAVADRVGNALTEAQAKLKSEAGKLFSSVQAAVPKTTPMTAEKTIAALEARAVDIGGVEKLGPAERALLTSLKDKKGQTYEWIKSKKGELADIAFGQADPFPGFSKSFKRQLTATLGEDMIAAAERVGGAEIKDALRLANRLTQKYKGVEDRIGAAFGKDGFGSIATKLRSAINTGAKGDIAGLRRVLDIVPENMRADAIGTAISSLSRAKGGVAKDSMGASDLGGFGFSEFANTYRGLKGNSTVWKTVADHIGPEGSAILDDLYRVSRAITNARGNVSTTGAANQALSMVPKSIVENVLQSTSFERGVQAAAGAGGSMIGGIYGAAIATPLALALTKSAPDTLALAGKLFRSPEFMALAEKGGTAAASEALKKSSIMQRFADKIGKPVADFFTAPVVAPAAGAAANEDYHSLYGRY